MNDDSHGVKLLGGDLSGEEEEEMVGFRRQNEKSRGQTSSYTFQQPKQ